MLDNITTTTSTPGKTPTHRKINKLMMEKRRRTRINNCLSELKTLVLKALKKDGEQFSKLEKVDILEMTVKYLRFLHQQQQVNLTTDSLGNKYRVPLDLSAEVMRYMSSDETRNRLTDHISKCVRVSNVAAAAAAQSLSNNNTNNNNNNRSSSTSSPTGAAALPPTAVSITVPHQINGTSQTNDHLHHHHAHAHVHATHNNNNNHTSAFIDNKSPGHIMLPIASKQSETSFLLAAAAAAAASSETQYKTVALSYTPITSENSSLTTNSNHQTHVVASPISSVTAISPAASPPSILHMKTLVPDNGATPTGCYLSTLPIYVSSVGQIQNPSTASVAGFYTQQQIKRNTSPDPSKMLPLWRPW